MSANPVLIADEAKKREIRERMQVLEAWKACSANGFERAAIEGLLWEYQDQLHTIQWRERYPGPEVPTDANDPDYWREKGEELRAEGEGLETHNEEERT